MKVFIEEGNRQLIEKEPVEILSNSFMRFSEIFLDNDEPRERKRPLVKDEDFVKNYQTEKELKKVECLYMMKVNDELTKTEQLPMDKTKLEVFEKNDEAFNHDMNSQMEKLQSKVRQRKINSILKGYFMRRYFHCQKFTITLLECSNVYEHK